jgi:hypothetical protein
VNENELEVIVRAVVDPLVSGLRQGQAAVEQFTAQTKAELTSLEAAGQGLNKAFSGIFQALAGALVIKGLTDVALGAEKVRDEFAQAAGAARNFGHAFDAAAMESWIARLSVAAQGGGYSFDQLAGAVQRFAAVGANQAQIQRLVADSTKLAAATGIDYETVVQALAKASQGTTTSLVRLGLGFSAASVHGKSFEQILEMVESRFAGAAEKRASSLAGQMGILGNQFRQVALQIGEQFVPVFQVIIGLVERALEWFEKLPAPVRQAAAVAGLLTAGLTALALILPPLFTAIGSIVAILGALGGVLGALLSPAGAVIAALTALAATVIWAATKPEQFRAALASAWSEAKRLTAELVQFIADRFRDVATIFGGVMDALTGHWRQGVAEIKAGVSDAAGAYRDLGEAIYTHVHNGLSRAEDDVRAWVAHLRGIVTSVGSIAIPRADMGTLPSAGAAAAGAGGAHHGRERVDNAGQRFADLLQKVFDRAAREFAHQLSLAAHRAYIGGEEQIAASRAKAEEEAAAAAEEVRHREAMARATGRLTPQMSDEFAVQAAAAAQHLAQVAVSAAQAKLNLDQAFGKNTAEDVKALVDAQDNLRTKTDELAEAEARRNYDAATSAHEARDALSELAKKLPGLTLNAQTGMMSFNPWSVLLQVIEQTRMFADIMRVVNAIIKVFAQILDALRPVIDLLLRQLINTVNVFIEIYDFIARILDAFGLHLALINKLNTGLADGTTQLINIVHDIPTLNELASGKIAPLSAQGSDQEYSPITNTLLAPQLGGGILGVLKQLGTVLIAGFTAVVVSNAASKAFGFLGPLGGILGGVIGAAVGLAVLGGLSHMFGSAGSAMSGAMSGAAININRAGSSVAGNLSAAGNELAASMTRSATAVHNAATAAANAVHAVARSLNSTVNMTNHFHGPIHGYHDVERLGKDLADAASWQSRMRAYEMTRVAF